MATHSSILAWRIPGTEESGCLSSMGWQELDLTEQLNNIDNSYLAFRWNKYFLSAAFAPVPTP